MKEAMVPMDHYFDAGAWREVLQNFTLLASKAEPEELQQMLKLLVKEITWMPQNVHEGIHHVEFFLPASRPDERSRLENWFESKGWSGCPRHRSCEPVILQLWRHFRGGFIPDAASALIIA